MGNTFTANRRRIAVLLLFTGMVVLTLVGLPIPTPVAHAQSSSRNDRSDDDDGDSARREERRRDWRRDRDENDDDDRPSRSTNSSTSSSRSVASASDAATSMNMTDYAKSLVKQHDKNGNMMLEADERGELKGKAASADLNKDNVIVTEELVAHLSSSSPTAAAPAVGNASATDSESSDRSDRSVFGLGRGDRGRDSRDDRSETDSKAATMQRVFTGSAGGLLAGPEKNDKRRSYRFTPPAERLPSSLPSWFKSRDRNGDGQVAMSEYSRSWSTRTVAEFRRYDPNDDGIITPKEAAIKR